MRNTGIMVSIIVLYHADDTILVSRAGCRNASTVDHVEVFVLLNASSFVVSACRSVRLLPTPSTSPLAMTCSLVSYHEFGAVHLDHMPYLRHQDISPLNSFGILPLSLIESTIARSVLPIQNDPSMLQICKDEYIRVFHKLEHK